MRNVVEVPAFHFSKGARLGPAQEQLLEKYLKDLQIDFTSETPSRMRLDRAVHVDDLLADQVEWAEQRLGISLIRRIPYIRKIHFLPSEEHRLGGDPHVFGRTNATSQEIFLYEQSSESRTMQYLSHELVHVFSRNMFNVEKALDQRGKTTLGLKVRLSGFRNMANDTFAYFNEIVTEAINIEVLSFQRAQGRTDYLADGHEIAYAKGVIFLSNLFSMCARRVSMKPEEVKRQIYRGYFTGDPTVLRLIARAFDETQTAEPLLKQLASLKENYYDAAHLHHILLSCGADPEESRESLRQSIAYNKGEEIELFGGIKLKLKIPA